MSDTLVVAISQSRHHHRHQPHRRPRPRPAARAVIAIVNRRNSDLTDKADGVLYTSDGRDVEMSVASTKAFYAQIAAGFLLAVAIADALGAAPTAERAHELLAALRDAARRRWRPRSPAARRIAEAAQQLAPPPPLLGRRRQRRQPHRRRTSCGSSSPSSATSRSPATPPRTRSTSTSRPSR